MNVTNTNRGHEIHKELPQLVIDSIHEVAEAVCDMQRDNKLVRNSPRVAERHQPRLKSSTGFLAGWD